MRTIRRTAQFRKDYKRESKGKFRGSLDVDLAKVVEKLVLDVPLAAKFSDHPLQGEWKDCRDCHVRFDLVLVYRTTGDDGLELLRLGSHSELGL